MKLFFDQNLSHRLVSELQDLFPGSTQARFVNLEKADDAQIWDYAVRHGYTIVTQDADFEVRSRIQGFPPKIIWLTCGNTSTQNIENLLRLNTPTILAFEKDADAGCLEIY